MSSLEPAKQDQVRSPLIFWRIHIVATWDIYHLPVTFVGYNDLQEQIKAANNEKKKLQVSLKKNA